MESSIAVATPEEWDELSFIENAHTPAIEIRDLEAETGIVSGLPSEVALSMVLRC